MQNTSGLSMCLKAPNRQSQHKIAVTTIIGPVDFAIAVWAPLAGPLQHEIQRSTVVAGPPVARVRGPGAEG